jgi:Uma2 family endonuclease
LKVSTPPVSSESQYSPDAAMSIEDWSRLTEDVDGELVNGRLTEEEVSDSTHEMAVAWFVVLIGGWLRGRGGFLLTSDAKYAVAPGRGRKPDITVYLPQGRVPPRRGLIRTPPDIAVEVVSPSPRDERRDRVEKMDEYASFGVHFYWLLDPTLGSLEIFERGADGRYARALAATSGKIEAIPGCPGLALDLDDLWSEIARLGPPEE